MLMVRVTSSNDLEFEFEFEFEYVNQQHLIRTFSLSVTSQL